MMLVVAPTKREIEGVRSSDFLTLSSAIVGVGVDCGSVFEAELARRPVNRVVSLGFAGGLQAGLSTGTIVCVDSLRRDGAPDVLHPPEAPFAVIRGALDAVLAGVVAGGMCTVPAPALDPEEKRRLGANGDLIVDMEGYVLAEIADSAGVDLVAIRVVLDEVDDELPDSIPDLVAGEGSQAWLATKAVLAKPHQLGDFVRLGRKSRQARQALARAAGIATRSLLF